MYQWYTLPFGDVALMLDIRPDHDEDDHNHAA